MINFQDKPETKKGNVAENIIKNKLISAGYTVYQSVNDTPHELDFAICKGGDLSLVEVKCKELRYRYPDTGFPIRNWWKYLRLNPKLTILWIDYKKKEIYGNTIDKLGEAKVIVHNGKKRTYPKREKHDIIYFAYEQMKVYGKLSDEEVEQIKSKLFLNR